MFVFEVERLHLNSPRITRKPKRGITKGDYPLPLMGRADADEAAGEKKETLEVLIRGRQ